MSEGNRPGFMLYFDALAPILNELRNEDLGELLRAVYRYALEGDARAPRGVAGFAFQMLKPRLDRDAQRYMDRSLSGQYAAYCRFAREKGLPELSFEEWATNDRMRPHATACDRNQLQLHPHPIPATSPSATATAPPPRAAPDSKPRRTNGDNPTFWK